MLTICKRFGVTASIEDLTKSCNRNKAGGASLWDLKAAAEQKGLHASGVKISASKLKSLKIPAIAHLWSNHYVVVDGGMGDLVQVIDPPKEPEFILDKEFSKLYSGFALLLSDDPSAFPADEDSGPDLRLNTYLWDFGAIDEGRSVSQELTLKNQGAEELTILEVKPSCTCVTWSLSDFVLRPGASASMSLKFDPTGKSGSQPQTVTIRSNDPVTPAIQLQIRGTVKPLKVVFSPKRVDFGTVNREKPTAKQVYVDSMVDVKSVHCDLPFVSAGVSESADEQHTAHVVSISLKPEVPIGSFSGKLIIETGHPTDPTLEVPLSGTVIGGVQCSVDSLFFGTVRKGASKKLKMTVRPAAGRSVRVESVKNLSEHLSVKLVPITEGKEYRVVVQLLRDAPPGYYEGNILIKTDDPGQPEIRVPAYALVQD
jgi:hypothetical protein